MRPGSERSLVRAVQRALFVACCAVAGCALEPDEPAAHGGAMLDAEAGLGVEGGRDAAFGSDAALSEGGADASPVDAGPPGPEPGRLAGITAAHNAVRARVGASPALAPLVWSSAIAAVAQAYATQLAAGCADLVHSPSPARMGWARTWLRSP